ncbi:hypothetical protein XENTR_v10012174 [Xenopus tropicalis]|nr:hypothetical protein XENTR_v10012174 [Xenopus tropicalis]
MEEHTVTFITVHPRFCDDGRSTFQEGVYGRRYSALYSWVNIQQLDPFGIFGLKPECWHALQGNTLNEFS